MGRQCHITASTMQLLVSSQAPASTHKHHHRHYLLMVATTLVAREASKNSLAMCSVPASQAVRASVVFFPAGLPPPQRALWGRGPPLPLTPTPAAGLRATSRGVHAWPVTMGLGHRSIVATVPSFGATRRLSAQTDLILGRDGQEPTPSYSHPLSPHGNLDDIQRGISERWTAAGRTALPANTPG